MNCELQYNVNKKRELAVPFFYIGSLGFKDNINRLLLIASQILSENINLSAGKEFLSYSA